MELEPHAFFKYISEVSQDPEKGPKECLKLFKSLNYYLLKEQPNKSLLELYILHIFDKTSGLLSYIAKCSNKKNFKEATIQALEILYTLINNFPNLIEKYIVAVNETCLLVLGNNSTTDEKVKALDTLTLGFREVAICLEHQQVYREAFSTLKTSYSIRKCDSVKDKILVALGMFAKKFPYLVEDPNSLKLIFIHTLEREMMQNRTWKMIHGLFTGLQHFCDSFPLSPEDDRAAIEKLNKYVEEFVKDLKSRIKAGNRAALTFWGKNMNLFAQINLKSSKRWHKNILEWFDLGVDEKKVAAVVLPEFYRAIAQILEADEMGHYRPALDYFLKYFKEKLLSGDITNYEKRTVLKGLSSFAPAVKRYLTPEEITALFTDLMRSLEMNLNAIENDREYFPDYIETIAKYMQFKTITISEVYCLQRAVVNMIKIFHQLPVTYHGFVLDSIVSTFNSLKINGKIFDNFVEEVVHQSILWTCSHQNLLEAETGDKSVVTVKNYFPMWLKLLKITPMTEYDTQGIYLKDRKEILVKIVEKLVRTMLIFINKLNVNISLKEIDAPVTDIQNAYKLEQNNDFAIFLNMVDLYKEILLNVEPSIMKNCVCKLIRHLVAKSINYPLISGFYKLLSYCLNIANRLNYFKDDQEQDQETCRETLVSFLQLLLSKINYFKNELLIACLQLLLEYPIPVIKENLPLCVPAFNTMFQVGKSYFPLVEKAIKTLEYWQIQIPDEMDSFLIQIIPNLDSYLRSKSLGGLSKQNMEEKKKRKGMQALKKRKIVVGIEAELVEVQRSILNFIGKQNSIVCKAFVSDNDVKPMAWENNCLKITLPYEDGNLDIYLDQFVPRVIDLALNCSDRKTRVEACEVLQAIVMIFLGTTKQMSFSNLQNSGELFQALTLPLLQLGCDLDQVVQQLFQPLCFQMIRWYTHPSQLKTTHSAILIEAMMEGITHPTDSGLRDFSGKCVGEFVKWTIKHSSESRLAKDPANIKVLLDKMQFFSSHPDCSKKLGAALIFNNIYTDLREENAILSGFWVEYLYIFLTSLSQINHQEENTITQINTALNHLQRGFVERHQLFNSHDENRRIPHAIKGSLLSDVVVWILHQTGSKSVYCRTKSFELFAALAPLTGYNNLQSFVSANVRNIEEIHETYIDKYPTLTEVVDKTTTGLMDWMSYLLCTFDGYNFSIRNNLIKSLTPTLIQSIKYFIKKLATARMEQALKLIEDRRWIYTTLEQQEFRNIKSAAILKLFQLFHSILSNHLNSFSTFSGDALWNLIVNAVFYPIDLGMNKNYDVEILKIFLRCFFSKLPENQTNELVDKINVYVEENLNLNLNNIKEKNRSLIKGLLLLQSCNIKQINLEKFSYGLIEKILESICNEKDDQIIYLNQLQDTTLEYCSTIFQYALVYPNEFNYLVDSLYKPNKVQALNFQTEVNFGLYLFSTFENSLVEKIVQKISTFLEISLPKDRMDLTLDFIFHVINYITSNKNMSHFKAVVLESILNRWETFELHFNKSFFNTEIGIKLVNTLLGFNFKSNFLEINLWLRKVFLLEHDQHRQEFEMKAQVFHLIAYFEDAEESEHLKTGLDKFKQRFFSNESVFTTEEKANTFSKLTIAVADLKSPVLLQFLLEVFLSVKETNDWNFRNNLRKLILFSKESLQKVILDEVVAMCRSENFTDMQKYKLITNAMVLFQNCIMKLFEEFFEENIYEIIANLKEQTSEYNLIIKILNFHLLEVLFLRAKIENNEELSSLAKAASQPNNKKLLQTLLSFTLKSFKDPFIPLDNLVELFRLYKCSSYNAMVSIICNLIKDQNIYTKLFIRLEDNEDILWKGLIDVGKIYVFEKDFDNKPVDRNVLINIRTELRTSSRHNQSRSVHYLQSQRLFNSSLAEDMTKFDFTTTILRSQPLKNDEEEDESRNLQTLVQLENVDVNSHECMATVCGLIEHIFKTGISSLPKEDEEVVLPPWAKGIRTILMTPQTHPNVKIFWVKVIHNTIHIFNYYAKWFLEPLLQFVAYKCAGTTINYFVVDVISILATWSNKVSLSNDNEIQLASDVFQFLIQNMDYERRDIFKYHLELLKLLVEAWKSEVTVNKSFLESLLRKEDVNSTKLELAIHLVSIFLANNIQIWNDFKNFSRRLCAILTASKSKSVYRACAEIVGLLLKITSDSDFLKALHYILKNISDVEKYAYILESLTLHYPAVADTFHIYKMLGCFSCLNTRLKAVFLRILVKRTSILNEVSDFINENWSKYLDNDELEIIIPLLEIIEKTLPILQNSPHLIPILQGVFKNVNNHSDLCRNLVYDIAISVFLNYNHLHEYCIHVLVQGLTDEFDENRTKIISFWTETANIPAEASRRLSFLLEKLYKNYIEDEFLGYCSYFLLDILKKQEDYNKLLFEYPLEDCEFQDYHVQTNWRLQHQSVVPLFAETVSTQNYEESYSKGDFGQIRATQNSLAFAPTESIRTQDSQYITSESTLLLSDNTFIDPNLINLSQDYKIPKRRFLKDKSKISREFAQHEVKKSSQLAEKRKEMAQAREKSVTIHRKYRKGDLPDIQITLSSALAPLQMLALHDGEISKIFYTSIFDKVFSKMKDDTIYVESIANHIKTIFTESSQFNPNLFRTLFDIILKNKNVMQFDPNLISSICQTSGLATLGTLVLEEYLIFYDDDNEHGEVKRTRGYERAGEINYWVKLAELYKEINEWDMVKSIFSTKMHCEETVKQALHFEFEGHWRDAQESYKSLLDTDNSVERKDFYYDSYFKCLAYLGEWNDVTENIKEVTDPTNYWNCLWDQSWNQQKLLPWFITGQLNNALFTQKKPTQFLAQINECLLDTEKREYVRSNFAEEIAMLFTFNEELDGAQQYLKHYMENFLDSWQLINPMFSTLRFFKILKLRNITDINLFVNVFGNVSEREAKIYSLLNYWNKTGDETLPSILLEETKVLYRKQFVRMLLKDLNDKPDFEDAVKELKLHNLKLDLEIIKTSLDQGNFYMARKYFKSLTKLNSESNEVNLYLSKIGFLKGEIDDNYRKKVDTYLGSLKSLEPIFESNDMDLKISAHIHQFNTYEKVTNILTKHADIFKEKQSDLMKILRNIVIVTPGDVELLASEKLKLFIEHYANTNPNGKIDEIGKAYVKLSYAIKRREGTKDFEHLILFVLRGMQFNSTEARQLFPYILIERDACYRHKDLFIEETSKIPTWMFLGWIPQLLVNIDSKMVAAIAPILLRIAKTYPQAIMYAYRLSKENFNMASLSEEAKDLIAKLDALLLSDKEVDKFLSALSAVKVPIIALKYYLPKLIKACHLKNRPKVEKIQKDMLENLFIGVADSRDVEAIHGNEYKKIKDFNKGIESINHFDYVQAENDLKELLKKLENKLKPSGRSSKQEYSKVLKDYSPWLANFSSSKLDFDLEIPGQYDGTKMPLVQHHVKISGFARNVEIMGSLRRPMKITILGNNTKEYTFLVKFGEDIRQDQRIEQLFTLMNTVFTNDNACNQREYSILTYQVIPLTTSFGLIQWLDQTTTLKGFIEKSVDPQLFKKLEYEYAAWIETRINKGDGDTYGTAAEKKSKDRTVAHYRKLVHEVPWDVLRRSFWKISASTEYFIALKNNFIKSYGVLCACHWILGIGDRHLNNTLISLKTGKAIGIDWGCCFGTATQVLPVPELVPFRLTPHIISVMEPIKESGFFKNSMIYCLKALRANKDSLLATMDVFIEEPSIDWIELASRFEETSAGVTWLPCLKVKQARMKLEGANSVVIMREDLNLNSMRDSYKRAYINLIKGDKADQRCRLDASNLSVEDQVDCLIDHATDYNLLGRMYVGWNSWV